MGDRDQPKGSMRYDRQVRLWGDHGQSVLEASSICLINASVCGVETLKNLILPGVKSAMIVDGQKVSSLDVSNNFFVRKADVGQDRAFIVARYLQLLNPAVDVQFETRCLKELLDLDVPSNLRHPFFSTFSLIVASQPITDRFWFDVVLEDSRNKLMDVSRAAVSVKNTPIPILVLESIGMLGYIRVASGEMEVVEAHPDSVTADLRVVRSFPELDELAQQPDYNVHALLSARDRKAAQSLSHLPWVFLVKHFLSKDGGVPSSHKEKQAFRGELESELNASFDAMTHANAFSDESPRDSTAPSTPPISPPPHFGSPTPPLGSPTGSLGSPTSPFAALPVERENITEALRAVNWCCSEAANGQIPASLRELFADARSDSSSHLPSDISHARFWLIIRALKKFCAEHGCVPLRGEVPDMTADSARYVRLQKAYRERANSDAQEVFQSARSMCTTAESELVSLERVRLFCRNTHCLHVIDPTLLHEELVPANPRLKRLASLIEDLDGDTVWYVLLRAARTFYAPKEIYPGSCEPHSDLALDVSRLRAAVDAFLRQSDLAHIHIQDDYIEEMCRWGGVELHAVSALIGGVAAQQAIKLLTKQYVPLCNTLVYNGATHQITVLEL